MVIGVDAGCLGMSDNGLKAGVYYVALHLLRELARIDKKNTYILYSFEPIPQDIMVHFSPAWKNVVLPSKGWLYLSLPIQLFRDKPDVFLALSQAMPWYHPKTIGFIHGLDFLPEFHHERNKKLQKNSEYLIQYAVTLITTSQFLKKSLETKYHINCVVAPLGIDAIFFQRVDPYIVEKPYFLFVGTLKSSKNIPTILKAFARFLHIEKKDFQLLLIGSDFWLDEGINKTIHRLQLNTHVTFVKFVENNELVAYYKGATAFVSPSLYEGFGMTFVEAMATGCPIIGSNVGGIPEIVGNAGLLFDPMDTTGIADAMIKIAEDKKCRDRLITNGIKRAKEFSWGKFACNVLKEINSV